jgi:Flp pilus assembly CpaE family ATPase
MPAHTRPEDITAMVISTSDQRVVIAAEVSIDLLRRHARLLRELARLAEEMPEEDGR